MSPLYLSVRLLYCLAHSRPRLSRTLFLVGSSRFSFRMEINFAKRVWTASSFHVSASVSALRDSAAVASFGRNAKAAQEHIPRAHFMNSVLSTAKTPFGMNWLGHSVRDPLTIGGSISGL